MIFPSSLFAVALFSAVVSALPQAPPTITPAPTNRPVINSDAFTFGPGYTVTSTVINGQTYPIFNAGVQGGYHLTGQSYSFTGLLGVGMVESYTTAGSMVYPVYDFTLAEADSEIFTIPGFLTFRDGGLTTDGTPQPTDVYCNLDTAGHTGCQGLEGLVTGAILGQPFTNVGGMRPTLAVGSTGIVAANTASGIFNSASGGLNGGIVAGPSATSLGGGGSDSNGPSTAEQNGHFTASYVVGASTTKAGGCISMGSLNQCLPPAATAMKA